MSASACVFCQIVSGEAPASIVHQDDECCVFMDTSPINPGHILIVPRLHATYLRDLDEELGAGMFKLALRISGALRRCGVKADGLNMYLADGEAGGQEVFHVHLHLFPRFEGDGFGLRFGPAYDRKPQRAELDQVAALIRAALYY